MSFIAQIHFAKIKAAGRLAVPHRAFGVVPRCSRLPVGQDQIYVGSRKGDLVARWFGTYWTILQRNS